MAYFLNLEQVKPYIARLNVFGLVLSECICSIVKLQRSFATSSVVDKVRNRCFGILAVDYNALYLSMRRSTSSSSDYYGAKEEYSEDEDSLLSYLDSIARLDLRLDVTPNAVCGRTAKTHQSKRENSSK